MFVWFLQTVFLFFNFCLLILLHFILFIFLIIFLNREQSSNFTVFPKWKAAAHIYLDIQKGCQKYLVWVAYFIQSIIGRSIFKIIKLDWGRELLVNLQLHLSSAPIMNEDSYDALIPDIVYMLFFIPYNHIFSYQSIRISPTSISKAINILAHLSTTPGQVVYYSYHRTGWEQFWPQIILRLQNAIF